MVGLQNVDCLNCTKTILFPLKKKCLKKKKNTNKKGERMPVNARSLPEINVHPRDVTFSYLKKKVKTKLISNTAELGT